MFLSFNNNSTFRCRSVGSGSLFSPSVFRGTIFSTEDYYCGVAGGRTLSEALGGHAYKRRVSHWAVKGVHTFASYLHSSPTPFTGSGLRYICPPALVLTDVHAAAPMISYVGGQQGFSCHRRQWAVAVPGEPFSWQSGALPKGQWASWSSVCLLKGLSLSQLAWVDVVRGSEMPLRCPGALLEDADLGLETS